MRISLLSAAYIRCTYIFQDLRVTDLACAGERFLFIPAGKAAFRPYFYTGGHRSESCLKYVIRV